jgi:hypothetical protein
MRTMTQAGGIRLGAAIVAVSAIAVAALCWASEVQATAMARGERCDPYAFQVCWR